MTTFGAYDAAMTFVPGSRVRIPQRPDLPGYVRIELAVPVGDGWQLFVEEPTGSFQKVELTREQAIACETLTQDGGGASTAVLAGLWTAGPWLSWPTCADGDQSDWPGIALGQIGALAAASAIRCRLLLLLNYAGARVRAGRGTDPPGPRGACAALIRAVRRISRANAGKIVLWRRPLLIRRHRQRRARNRCRSGTSRS